MSAFESKLVLQNGREAVHGLRRALAGLITSAGAESGQPQEVSRRFGVDKTLAWRISRAVREEDPWEALPHLPSRAGITIFAEAMARAGAPVGRMEDLWKALGEFEKFVETHARDRDTLDMIVSSPSRASAKKLEAFRKSGFQCNSSLLGVRAGVQLASHFVAPSSKVAGMVDVGVASGLVELCRLRPSVPWSVATIRNWGGHGGDVLDASLGVVPVEEGTPGEVVSPLIREFCSPRSVEVRAVEQPKGTFRYMLDAGPVGFAASADVFSGWVNFATAPMDESAPGERGEHGINLCTPAEELVFDLLIHRELEFAMDVSAQVYSQFPGGPQYPDAGSEHSTMPVPTDVLDLGMTVPDAPSALVPRYGEFLERVAARMGRSLGDFRAFRYRLKYPPIPAMALLSHPLRRV